MNYKFTADWDAKEAPVNPRGYDVANFGIDEDILSSLKNLKDEEKIHGEWIIPGTKETEATIEAGESEEKAKTDAGAKIEAAKQSNATKAEKAKAAGGAEAEAVVIAAGDAFITEIKAVTDKHIKAV